MCRFKKCDGRIYALQLRFDECMIPHPDKASYGGEDAYFVSSVHGGACGVSDGVGGWQDDGINPAEYSRTLMEYAKKCLEGSLEGAVHKGAEVSVAAANTEIPVSSTELDDGVVEVPSTVEALDIAHKLTRKPGSATACILKLDPNLQVAEATNLGDSGFIVIRNGRVIFKTPAQQHFFDCPYQLGAAPEYVPETDRASDSMQFRLDIQQDDVIVMGTDGLWDNLPDDDIARVIAANTPDVAKVLAEMASRNAQNPEYDSPYAIEARNEGIELPFWDKLAGLKLTSNGVEMGKLTGGKLDDITVIVARVSQGE